MSSSITKEMLARALERLEALQEGEITPDSDVQLKERAEEVAELALKAIATCVKYDLSANAQSTIDGLGTFTYASGQIHFTPEEHVLKYAALKEQDFESTQQALRNTFVTLLYLANRILPETEVSATDTVDPAICPSTEDKLMAATFGRVPPNRFEETVSRLMGELIHQLMSAGLNIGISPATSKTETVRPTSVTVTDLLPGRTAPAKGTWEKVVTAYDSVDKAKNALKVLQNAGYDSSDISVIDRTTLATHDTDHVGLWRRLFGENVWEHEAAVYGATLDKGGAILAARVPGKQVAKVMALLDVHQPLDVHAVAAKIGEKVPIQAKALVTPPIAKADAKDGETLRLAEEQLNVGKRVFETGTTRIRRFVIERPVEAQVTLLEEHADVVRRAITDPSYVADIDWSDKAFEVTETAEQAMVSKSARVVEEVTLRKSGTDRVETVKDTVRRQQVEVEKVAPVKRYKR